jgi:hypothetical protein
MDYATQQGKPYALQKLAERRENAKHRTKLDNATLPAGSPMYFYCIACGLLADTKPESYNTPPKKLCDECQALKEVGWLE